MKFNCNDYFSKEKIGTIHKKLGGISQEVQIKILGLSNVEELRNVDKKLNPEQEMQAIRGIINTIEADILAKEGNIKDLFRAIQDMNSNKINEIKNNIIDNEYWDILADVLFINLMTGNDKVVEFLLEYTELRESDNLKFEICMDVFVNRGSGEWNSKIIKLSLTDQNWARIAEELLTNYSNLDRVLIKFLIKSNIDVDSDIIMESCNEGPNGGGMLLLDAAIYSRRYELAEWLLKGGAKGLDFTRTDSSGVPKLNKAITANPDFFEILKRSGRLEKKVDMSNQTEEVLITVPDELNIYQNLEHLNPSGTDVELTGVNEGKAIIIISE